MELTSVAAGGTELAAPVEKAAAGPIKKTMQRSVSAVKREKGGRWSLGAAERENGGWPVAVEHAGVARSRCSMPQQCRHGGAFSVQHTTALRVRWRYKNEDYRI
jgi:hypothetical protein